MKSKLSEGLTQRFKNVGSSIQTAHRVFTDLYKEACIEIGGKEWPKSDRLPEMFEAVQRAVKAVLVDDPQGPQLSLNSFNVYCAAARKCLVFDVPWRFGMRVRVKDLAEAKKRVETYEDSLYQVSYPP